MARSNIVIFAVAAGALLVTAAPALDAHAQVRGAGRASIARNHPASHPHNNNHPNHPDHNGGGRPNHGPDHRDIDIHNDIDIDVDHRWDWDDPHPIARGVAFGAAAAVTSAVVGSMLYSLPPACSPYAGSYYYCGGVYYAPRYQGDTVVYVVVDRPG